MSRPDGPDIVLITIWEADADIAIAGERAFVNPLLLNPHRERFNKLLELVFIEFWLTICSVTFSYPVLLSCHVFLSLFIALIKAILVKA